MEELVRHGGKRNNKGKGVKRKGVHYNKKVKERSKEKRSYTTTTK